MANGEHVALLKKGVDAWNEWRLENRGPRGPNLTGANLIGAILEKADLSWADLTAANLTEANLTGAQLEQANLTAAKLGPRANLHQANLIRANLHLAYLGGTDLSDTLLLEANLTGANLSGAQLSTAVLSNTVFGQCDLREAKGLDQCSHEGPSIIDFQTLQKSGPLPLAFLRGVGLPDNVIEYLPSLLNEAIQHYSCFISYSSKDQTFAERLHADLQNKGVRCWFAPHDMRIGAKIIDAIDEAIRLRDKVLLILSEGAIASDWVEGEVTRALDEEGTRKQVVLFPVRLDDAVMHTSEGWARLLRGQRNVGDFTGWKEHDSYQKSLDRLMRDLRVEASLAR
jgi:TIR domain/Pentapeptide repeats (8 copies)